LQYISHDKVVTDSAASSEPNTADHNSARNNRREKRDGDPRPPRNRQTFAAVMLSK
jgi:hypothetical protein